MVYFPQDATLRLLEHLRNEGVSIPPCFSPPGANVDDARGYRRIRDRRASLTFDINEAIRRRDSFNADTGTAGNRANYDALVRIRRDADALAKNLAELPYRAGLERLWPSPVGADLHADYVPTLGELRATLVILARKAEEGARHLSKSGQLEADILTLAVRERLAERAEYLASLPAAERAEAMKELPPVDPTGPIVRDDGRIVATPQAAFLLGLEDAFKEHLIYPAPDDEQDAITLMPDDELQPDQLERKAKLRAWRPKLSVSTKGAPPDAYTSFALWISAEIGEPTSAVNIRRGHERIPVFSA